MKVLPLSVPTVNLSTESDDEAAGSINNQTIDSCLIGYNQSAADSSIISDVDCATSRVKDKVTSGGINLLEAATPPTESVMSVEVIAALNVDVALTVECRQKRHKSCVAIYLKATINLSIV